jgi:hypothetical protein
LNKLNRILTWIAATLFLGSVGCGGTLLPLPTDELVQLVQRLGQGDAADDAALAPDIERLNQILLEAYEDNYVPIPEGQLVPFNPLRPQDYNGFDALRWGYGLPSYPGQDSSVGALVARPVSTAYSNQVPWFVKGDLSVVWPINFRTYERTFASGADQDFLNGITDRVEADNHVVYKAVKGVVFEYTTHSIFRRIKGANLPGGEVLGFWDLMETPATNLTGNYNAYNTWLRGFYLLMPLSDKLSWQFMSNWSVAGGSFFVITESGTSGDIADGIRKDFVDTEAYLTAQGLSCQPNCN